MKDVVAQLVRYNISCTQAFEADAGLILRARPGDDRPEPDSYGHETYTYAAAPSLALYLTAHPLNPQYRNAESLRRYVTLADRWVTYGERAQAVGKKPAFTEWTSLLIARGLERLRTELDPGQRRRWEKFLLGQGQTWIPAPFSFASPHHEAWKLAVLALGARVLQKAAWREVAAFKARQLLRYQTAEGFWEEGCHNGPSMKYNSLMLAALVILARETGISAVLESARRLAVFMVRWAFPDGVLVGAFDSRQSTSPGYFGLVVPGLELAPGGLTHVQRILNWWDRLGWLDQPRAIGPSTWHAHFGMPCAAEALLYYAAGGHRPRPGRLPLDYRTARLENHSATFDGILIRQGPWCVAVSGQFSNMPPDTRSKDGRERQSRLEIWHQRASVVLGGGHSVAHSPYPLFNAWVDSGYEQDPASTVSPRLVGDASGPDFALRRSCYYPRQVCSGTHGNRVWLELIFAQATVRYEVHPVNAEALDIFYTFECLPIPGGVKELRLALPIVLWRTARGFADTTDLPAKSRLLTLSVRRELVVETPVFGTRTILTLPPRVSHEVRWPLEPVRTDGTLFPRENFESFFRVAQVETILCPPPARKFGHWRLTVRPLR